MSRPAGVGGNALLNVGLGSFSTNPVALARLLISALARMRRTCLSLALMGLLFAHRNKNPGIAAGVLHFVLVSEVPGSAMHHFVLHRVRDDFVA